ncbi:MAG: DNA-binding response regulator, partial [Candidatus Dormibacteraeota bacterium]|nr:DNA-binding response regulator [Candidatus Dormibacteraeota bacterium]
AAASACGRDPQPGLALLRLMEGDTGGAKATIRAVLEDVSDQLSRARLLDAYVEIMLAAGDIPAARDAAQELSRIAAEFDSVYLRALAGHALGATLLAEGEARAATTVLREARSRWGALDAPYESARARLLIGLACRELGDEVSAAMEIEVARQTFDRIGAAPDLARVDELNRPGSAPSVGALSGREVEVLALVATGKTNRQIATSLSLSEKTVARHLSNIFAKLDVSSRAAATAYAFKHDLA